MTILLQKYLSLILSWEKWWIILDLKCTITKILAAQYYFAIVVLQPVSRLQQRASYSFKLAKRLRLFPSCPQPSLFPSFPSSLSLPLSSSSFPLSLILICIYIPSFLHSLLSFVPFFTVLFLLTNTKYLVVFCNQRNQLNCKVYMYIKNKNNQMLVTSILHHLSIALRRRYIKLSFNQIWEWWIYSLIKRDDSKPSSNIIKAAFYLYSICKWLRFCYCIWKCRREKRHFNRSSHQLFSVPRLLNCVLFFNVMLSNHLTAVLGRVNHTHIYIEIFYTRNIKSREKPQECWAHCKGTQKN